MAKINLEKPEKRIMGGKEKVKVAAIQAPQIVFNKEKSIDIACQKIKEAGANGAELVAFSESYIPVFAPYYSSTYNSKSDEWALWNIGLQDNSIVIPSDDTDRICNACRDAGVYCVMGVNELDDAEGSRTFYNTQIFFGPEGTILGRHRKIKPTYNERVYWGEGDGSDLGVYKTPIGRIGSLICWEHHTAAIRAAQLLMGEEFHISNWPGTWTFTGERAVNANYDPQTCDGTRAARAYAFDAGSFVISVHGLLREQDFEPEYKSLIGSKDLEFDWANGGSCIINPFGEFIAEPVFDEDTILYADCYANEIKAVKTVFDGLGHYSRPDVARVVLNADHPKNLNIISASDTALPNYQQIKRISEEYEVKIQKLEKLVAKLENAQ
ncbi:MAG: carbon-nitrogen hydrolase family protein [Lachnospiraceae bacterium]|nr:carbon-nitrogen hydrolase family protein [Lachnospiraceae bacterium]